jgi:CubicO group peptidase (beta-lactamase class C family)
MARVDRRWSTRAREIQVIEDAELWFEPGTVTCYSPQAFGFQLGEVVRRVSGQSLPEFFRVEFADPLGVDFHFSISDPATLDRVADQWPDLEEELPTGMAERLMAEVVTSGQWVSRRFVSTVAPAASGLSNGRALARVGAMLAMGGELGGRRYLSRSILDEASSEQTLSEDLALGPIRYGLGFGLDSDSLRASTPTSFHWGGYGGSFITMDMATGISAGFSPNRLRVADSFAPEGRLSTLWKLLGDAVRNLA